MFTFPKPTAVQVQARIADAANLPQTEFNPDFDYRSARLLDKPS
jgi:hypothetical protein